jgi:hypothetical protein
MVGQELKSLFPSWKISLLPAEQPFREGRYQLKLSWADVWRRLEAPANTSLEDVTGLLLESFGFEQDHMYRLDYRDACGREVFVEDPGFRDGELFAAEVLLGEVPLNEGESMGLLFDFGDSWRFTITIENIDESPTDDFEPQITASHGEAPKQYDFAVSPNDDRRVVPASTLQDDLGRFCRCCIGLFDKLAFVVTNHGSSSEVRWRMIS